MIVRVEQDQCADVHAGVLRREDSSSCRRRREAASFLQEKISSRRLNSAPLRNALDASPGGPGSRRRMMFRSVTRSISIHYAIESQKDLAGASIEFDVRQAGNIDAA
ncbi:hypothetical protein [Bradyrhizobium yuanmingense]|uniref:hypothetical protein n=1 Tax=Bradyrhizobium yuanmingense TaxID=108015 RepID=UPI001CD6D933|nr:hypothetical protein [Bradyrhizobium yuanmingense]MCA1525615.1 hypothetical protein [Bradyrhizobium yuanmingense]